MNMCGFTLAVFGNLREQFTAFLPANSQNKKTEFHFSSVVYALIMAGQVGGRALPTVDSGVGVTYREDHPRVSITIRVLVTNSAYTERLWL